MHFNLTFNDNPHFFKVFLSPYGLLRDMYHLTISHLMLEFDFDVPQKIMQQHVQC